MGRSGNPVLSEEQKKKMAMRGGVKGGPRGGGGGGRGGGRGGRGGGGRGGRGGGGGPPPGHGGFGGPPGGPPPAFAQARYGFFTNDMPSGPIGHVNKQFVDSRPPVNTPSASTVGGGSGPIRPPNGGPLIFPPSHRGAGDESTWVPVGPPRPLMGTSLGGGMGGSGAGGMTSSATNGAASRAQGAIHELFGKMVWKKMESLEDPTEVDTLQNEIMDLIAKAVKKQQERKMKEEEQQGQSEAIPYGKPHPANNGDAPAYGNVADFGGYKPYQGPGFF
ncbi:pqn-70 [Pristionchus pacificus]|uniref:Pqn-70 n=1 Tax=Pristionchus pacificus TaxID=54126 RepID=A0A2A6CR87_PRIPA|nr:pqn-70 [Pristionchus pacificus]|eukprot:PDM80541.1 pqn-70 [Pristionchus pacificus]